MPGQRTVERRNGTEMLARLSVDAPRVPWDRFIQRVFRWESGEHIGLIGPTGQGKTTLLFNLLPLKPFVAVFATKPKDKSMDRLLRAGYTKFPAWRKVDPIDEPRRVIWPDATRIDSDELQKSVFKDAMGRVYREGNWVLAFDEAVYISEDLGLKKELRTLLMQGRSVGISVIAATQRPRRIPLEVYDQSTHLFFWRNNDLASIQRMAEINVGNIGLMRYAIPNLEQHQALYVNTRTGNMVRTRAPIPEGG